MRFQGLGLRRRRFQGLRVEGLKGRRISYVQRFVAVASYFPSTQGTDPRTPFRFRIGEVGLHDSGLGCWGLRAYLGLNGTLNLNPKP